MKGDRAIESGADKPSSCPTRRPRKAAFGKLAGELADDASFLRKLKPSLMVKRAKGELPKDHEPGTATTSRPAAPSAVRSTDCQAEEGRPEPVRRRRRRVRQLGLARKADRLEKPCPPTPLRRSRASAPRQQVAEHASALAKLELELAGLELKQRRARRYRSRPGVGAAVVAVYAVGFLRDHRGRARDRARHLARAPARHLRAVRDRRCARAGRGPMIKREPPPVPELAIQEAKLTSEALKSDGNHHH